MRIMAPCWNGVASAMLLFLSLLVVVKASLRLNVENFDRETQGKMVMIKFVTEDCDACEEMHEAWEELAAEWVDHPVGLVAEVDCSPDDPHNSATICEDFDLLEDRFPLVYYGDLADEPHLYEGPLDFESLSEFAKEHISQPVCAVYKMETCSAEEKEIIADLQKKSVEELEEMARHVFDQLDEADAEFDRTVEEYQGKFEALNEEYQDKPGEELEEASEQLHDQYEAFVHEFNDRVDNIRQESHFRFVNQILSQRSRQEPVDEEKEGDEL